LRGRLKLETQILEGKVAVIVIEGKVTVSLLAVIHVKLEEVVSWCTKMPTLHFTIDNSILKQ